MICPTCGHEWRQRDRLTRSIEMFIERWQPHDEREAHQFNAELNMLVRKIYMDMQKPITETVSALLHNIYLEPVIISKKESKP